MQIYIVVLHIYLTTKNLSICKWNYDFKKIQKTDYLCEKKKPLINKYNIINTLFLLFKYHLAYT